MRKIAERYEGLVFAQLPLLLKDCIDDILGAGLQPTADFFSISVFDAETLRQATPLNMIALCEAAVLKGAIGISLEGSLLKQCDGAKEEKLNPFYLRLANKAMALCSTCVYFRKPKGPIGEYSHLSIDKEAVEVLKYSTVYDLKKLACQAVSNKALRISLDGNALHQAIAQHRVMSRTQAQIEHLVLAKAPTSMIKYFFPQESEKDITERRKSLGVYMKGQPKKITEKTQLNIYRLLGQYHNKKQYDQCVRIASVLDIDYLQLWSVVGEHFRMDEGDKMEMFEHKAMSKRLASLDDPAEKQSVVAGILSCSLQEAASIC